jgi:hypothetical protein
MPFPSNISKKHLLKAIKRIDNEGLPPDGTSQYYDVLIGNRRYPPKVVVSFANVFANGEELDRRSFAGGLNTPCFRLLEENGFKIVPKEKIAVMPNVKIYEVKSSANENYWALKSKDGLHFFWNETKFNNNDIGDFVYVVNRTGGEALFCRISEKGIAATYNSVADSSHFNNNNNSYDVRGQRESFLRFDILEERTIPGGWNWQTQLGSSEVYDLWKPELAGQTNRHEKIDDLEKIFKEDKAYDELENCRRLLTESTKVLAIVEAINDKTIQSYISATDYLHQLASDKLQELINFKPTQNEEFYQELIDKLGDKEVSFMDFLNRFNPASDEHKVLRLIGEVVAYCDLNAANKRELNQYPDKRVLALSFVRQTQWVLNLLKYKAGDNDPNSISSLSIRNAVNYLLNPETEITMLAENHRKMVARYLMKTAYDKASFVADLRRFFEPYGIKPDNSRNLTKIVSHILYRFDAVKQLWFEKVEGLVVCDNTGWFDDAIRDLRNKSNIVLWWDKLPSGGAATQKLLREQIADAGFFYIYYTANQEARYRSRIVDFALEDDYDSHNWNINEDVAWFQKDFKSYTDEREDGKVKKARIAFLADELIELKTPVGYDQFEFYRDYQPPTQNNMQPYAEIKAEVEAVIVEESAINEKEIRSIDATLNTLYFDDEMRQLLMAVKTKPFVLLAGISGTGKSRLARTLAYKTCALKELQQETPGNFLLAQVKPNWHDSTELLGYESRITGTPEYIVTAFTQFLVKAWRYPELPFVLCLDEMNLAPVEQYFAEYLSAIESREYKSGRLLTDPIIPALIFSNYGKPSFWKKLGIESDKHLQDYFQKHGLGIPHNLVVIGTVNMDESTHSFSRKVLDRAMTIEMNQVELASHLESKNNDWEYPIHFYSAELINGVHTFGGQVYQQYDEAKKVLGKLEEINKLLHKTPFKIAYRVRDEALIYCYHNSRLVKGDNNWIAQVLDEIICMKVLSRIEGDESKTRKPLEGLLVSLPETEFPVCHAKLKEMYDRLIYGYTSFWP